MKIFGLSVKKIPFYDDAHEKMLLLNSRGWQEIIRTFLVLLMLAVFMALDTSAQYLADSIYSRHVLNSPKYFNRPVFDLISSSIPVKMRLQKVFCDVSIFLLMVLAFLSTVVFNSRHRGAVPPFQGLTVLRRFCFIQAISHLFHSITVPFTLTPSLNAASNCSILSGSAVQFLKITFGQAVPCIDNSFSITVTLTSNLAFFTLAYSWNRFIKLSAILHATITIILLYLGHYNYSVSIALGLMASVFIFGTYHLLLLVFCQSKIFLGVAESASMGFDLFFLNGFFCRNATRIIEWVDGLDLRQLQPFVADLDHENDGTKSLLTSAKELIP